MSNDVPTKRECETCHDDGCVKTGPLSVAECPHLNEPWHRPFNYSMRVAGGYDRAIEEGD